MRQKAFQVYSQFRSGNTLNTSNQNKPDYEDDELALFGGQTRVLVTHLLDANSKKKQHTTGSPSASASPGSAISSPAAEHENIHGMGAPLDGSLPDVHPSLVEYLSTFSFTSPSCAPLPVSHRLIQLKIP